MRSMNERRLMWILIIGSFGIAGLAIFLAVMLSHEHEIYRA